jgi:mitogen-activated protein kinase 1/3/mitogen-activated protein kinase 6
MSSFVVCGNVFEVQSRYAPIKPIGKGAYGVVCSARDVRSDARVAIKKITNAFENAVDAKRTLREIKLLRHLRHENVIRIADVVAPVSKKSRLFQNAAQGTKTNGAKTSENERSVENRLARAPASFDDVYVMYELMDTDLHQIIRSNQPLSDDHCQYFVYQLLRGLKYIHSANVLHRDLKPSNLLLNANCDLKICDFGLARVDGAANARRDVDAADAEPGDSVSTFMTEYVVTRWYRAPELLLSCAEYTSAIDVWSVGCIFAELLGRKPLFPGKDYVHQLNLIARVAGTPAEHETGFVQSEKARRYLHALPRFERVDFRTVYPDAAVEAVDLIDKMLAFDPSKRITVAQALAHPYLASLHDESDEPSAARPFFFDFENETLSENRVRDLVYEELVGFHDEIRSAEAAARAEAS